MTTPADQDDTALILEQARQWAQRLQSGQVDTHGLSEFTQWQGQSIHHQQAWRQAAYEWKLLQQALQLKAEQAPKAPALKTPSPYRRHLLFALGSAGLSAACVGIIIKPPLNLWPGWHEWSADYRTSTGEQQQIQLSQQVSIWLNTQSSLALSQHAHATQLHLLKGEAMFSSLGQTCEILSQGVSIELEHGAMNVRQYPDQASRIQCLHGQITLHHSTGVHVLEPQQAVQLDPRQITRLPLTDSAQPDWRLGVLRFKQQTLSTVMDEINRYRPGKVVLLNHDLGQRVFSGEFRLDALDDAVLLLQRSYALQARHVGKIIVLS